MRVWDVHPGYLSRTRLLGEHREIHAVWTVIVQGKKGYARHPEVQRWRAHLPLLYRRHRLIVKEMMLRGYRHRSPLAAHGLAVCSVENSDSEETEAAPFVFIDPPHHQFGLLQGKYGSEERGRIPLPQRGYEFWSHHKYAVMLRGYNHYKHVSEMSREHGHRWVGEAAELVYTVYGMLRQNPQPSAVLNTWQHVIGYFKQKVPTQTRADWHGRLPHDTQELALILYEQAQMHEVDYIVNSTILADEDVADVTDQTPV